MSTGNINSKLGGSPIKLILIAGAAVLLLIFVVMLLGARSARASQERDVKNAFAGAAGQLSNCQVKTTQAVQVTTAQAAQFKEIIKITAAAITSTSAGTAVGKVDERSFRGSLMPILFQIYPDQNKAQDAFQRLLTIVNGCRDDFLNAQNHSISVANQYQSWIQGSTKAAIAGVMMSFPSHNLVLRLGDQTWRGQEALDVATKPLVVSDVVKAYQSGTIEQPNLGLTTTTTGG